jgi:thiamine biosynthesis lipoprotein
MNLSSTRPRHRTRARISLLVLLACLASTVLAADHGGAATIVHLHNGGLATSGDSRRFVIHHGRRLPHILDARTGWPVENALRSVTVAADTCTQAGTLCTLAMLQGREAARFLQSSGVRHWIQ